MWWTREGSESADWHVAATATHGECEHPWGAHVCGPRSRPAPSPSPTPRGLKPLPHPAGAGRTGMVCRGHWPLVRRAVFRPWARSFPSLGLSVPVAQQQSRMKVVACKCFTAADCFVPKGIVYSRSTCQAVQIGLPRLLWSEGAAEGSSAPAPHSCLNFGL